MIKVTVLYNLPPGTDEDEFVRWRTTTHHQSNISQPGVLKTDFYRIVGKPMIGPNQPASDSAPYRFMTEAYWPDLETFEAAWNDPEAQAKLVPAVAKIADVLFLVSEEVQSHPNV
jgi:EthD domain